METPVVALAVLGTEFSVRASAENTYLKVSNGTVCVENLASNAVEEPCLGPNQQLISGVFDRNKKFTPGQSTSYNITTNAVVTLNETVSQVNVVNTVNSASNTVQQLSTVASITIVGVGGGI